MTKEEFNILFDTYFEPVRNFIYYKSGDGEVATDIAQDTFLKIWEKQLKIEMETVKSLLFKMASNAFISYYRKRKTEYNNADLFRFDIQTNTPEEQLYYEELNNKYQKVLLEMPEKKRIVFLMSRMDGLKYAEIAQQLDISVKAVEKRMSEALTLLKEALLVLLLIIILYRFI